MIKIEVDTFLKDIIPKFLKARENDMETLASLLDKKSWKEIESIAHKIKGNAGSYGLKDLGIWGGELEQSCKSQNYENIPELISKMSDYLKNIEIVFVANNDEDDDDD